jgi:hypothetical protein
MGFCLKMEELRDCIELIRMCLVHCCYDGVGTRYMSGTKPNLYAEGHNFIFMNPPSWTNSRHQLILRTRSRWSKQEKVHFTVLADLHVGKRSVNYILVLHKSYHRAVMYMHFPRFMPHSRTSTLQS